MPFRSARTSSGPLSLFFIVFESMYVNNDSRYSYISVHTWTTVFERHFAESNLNSSDDQAVV